MSDDFESRAVQAVYAKWAECFETTNVDAAGFREFAVSLARALQTEREKTSQLRLDLAETRRQHQQEWDEFKPEEELVEENRQLKRELAEAREYEWKLTCIHHSDLERAGAKTGCKCCLLSERDELKSDKARLDAIDSMEIGLSGGKISVWTGCKPRADQRPIRQIIDDVVKAKERVDAEVTKS